jgi:hypothetical protein
MKKQVVIILLLLTTVTVFAQNQKSSTTAKERKALFDYIIEKTKIRESWSPIKNEKLGVDPLQEMILMEKEILATDTDEKLFYVLRKFSAARKDRHLAVRTVEGGLQLPNVDQGTAPLRFCPDFSDKKNLFLFVSDFALDIKKYSSTTPQIGDELITVNGEPIATYLKKRQAYIRYSTYENFIINTGYRLTEKSNLLPRSFFKEELTLELKPKDGDSYTITLPYLEKVNWKYGRVVNNYPGYTEVTDFKYETFKLYQPINANEKSLILWWYWFAGDLPQAIDALISWADKNNMLDYNLIIDAVDAQGGSMGAYAIASLSPKPFKTTGGNLKLSDITYDFVTDYTRRYLNKKPLMDHDTRETEDDGTWAVEWLNGPVLKGLAAGQDYSNNTPFKCAHLPYYSDWMMQPASKHFSGKMVVFLGPWGGSHLTQFASMIVDNDLAYTLGMPDGGYSNTWEWTETLVIPNTDKKIASFMWSIGHTLRPNGQIAEGNPPLVDEYIPLSRDNYLNYKKTLLEKARNYLRR